MIRLLHGDCRDVLPTLPADSVQCVVTSPPYFGLRDYGVAAQIGLEPTPDAYVAQILSVFREVRRVLQPDGTVWLNLGDSYACKPNGPQLGSGTLEGGNTSALEYRAAHAKRSVRLPDGIKHKDLLMIPARVAIALRADGWFLRSDVIWHKPNPMPESVADRPTSAHEHVFLLTRNGRYFYDSEAIREIGTVPDWKNGRRAFGGISKHGANVRHGQTTGRVAGRVEGVARRGLPPRHGEYASCDQSGLDAVGRGSGRNARDVWTIATRPYDGAHFATMPPALAERCIRAGSRPGDTVLDPFSGAGTTALVADRLSRHAIGIDLNPAYREIAAGRLTADAGLFASLSD